LAGELEWQDWVLLIEVDWAVIVERERLVVAAVFLP
jgi:hypothetical protein